jgi:peroxiredoxin
MAAQLGECIPHFTRQPVFGEEIDTASVSRARAIALVFLRHAGSAITRRTCMDLHLIVPELDLADVLLVALMEGDGEAVRDFVPRYHLKYPVVHDETGELFEAFSVGRDRMLRRTLLGLRPSMLRSYAEALQSGRGLNQGPIDRLGAALVVGVGGTVAWRWDAERTTDMLDVEQLRAAALAAAPRATPA